MIQGFAIAVCGVVPGFIMLSFINISVPGRHDEFFQFLLSTDLISRLPIISMDELLSLFAFIKKYYAGPNLTFCKQPEIWANQATFCKVSPCWKALEVILQEQGLTAVLATDCKSKWFYSWWLPSFWDVFGECTEAAGSQRRGLLWRNSYSQKDHGRQLQGRSSTHYPGYFSHSLWFWLDSLCLVQALLQTESYLLYFYVHNLERFPKLTLSSKDHALKVLHLSSLVSLPLFLVDWLLYFLSLHSSFVSWVFLLV